MVRGDGLRLVAFGLAVLCAQVAHAEGVRSPFPVAARARLDLRVVTGDATSPWAWNTQSRSPLDGSRFMTDVTAGRDATGVAYLKAAANWKDTDDALGRVAFTIEQGEYLYRRLWDAGSLSLRLFGDERRFFTGELGAPSMEDDVVARYQHRLGASVGAGHGPWNASLLAASLDDGADASFVEDVRAGLSATHAHAELSYRHSAAPDADDRAIARGEAGAWFRGASAIVSYAQSGAGDGLFLPSGSFDGDATFFAAAAPLNSQTSAELRLRRMAVGKAWVDAVYRYEAVGSEWVNDLAASQPGTVANEAGVYVAHRRYALDGRVTYRDEVRSVVVNSHARTLEASARAFLRDNSQLLLRGGAERREFHGHAESDAGFVQAGYRRELQRFMGGVHAALTGIGDDAVARTAVEARVNWTPTSALYARWIVADQTQRSSSVYARLEFRPTGRTWVTLAYGWSAAGDGPNLLDDRDGLPAADTRDVVSLTIRGDF